MQDLAGIADAADENLAIRSSWGHQETPGMRVQADHHLVMADSGMASYAFNTICRARFPRGQTRQWIGHAREWFSLGAMPFTWWVGPADYPAGLGSALAEAGLRQVSSCHAMALDLRGAQLPDDRNHLNPLWLEVRKVSTVADLEAFVAISAATTDPTDPWMHRYFDMTAGRLLQAGSPVRFHVGYLDGVPVACSETVVSGPVAGFYGVATLEAHRGQGIGSAMMLTSLRQSMSEGCIAAVASTPDASEPMFRRLGFTSFGRREEFRSA